MDYYKIINRNSLKIIEVLEKQKLYFNQIAEKTGIKSKNNIVKNLNDLTKLNMLKKEKNKSNTFYSLNYENNLVLSLLDLINSMKFQKLPFERRKAIEETILLVKPTLAVLFGSTAKGNFTKRSDIDLLFVYNKKTKLDIDVIASRYGISINPIIIEFKGLNTKDETIKHILKTGYPITGGIYFYKILENA